MTLRHTRTLAAAMATAFGLATASAVTQAQTTTLNFGTPVGLECRDGASTINFSSYGGFAFTGLRQAQPIGYGGGCVGTNSGTFVSPSFFTRIGGGAFTFESAQFGGVFPNAGTGTTISVLGSLNGATVFQSTLTLGVSGDTPVSFAPSGPRTIDRFQITQTGNNPFFIDNLTTTVSTVPEPSTWALMTAGLLAIGAVARRKRSV